MSGVVRLAIARFHSLRCPFPPCPGILAIAAIEQIVLSVEQALNRGQKPDLVQGAAQTESRIRTGDDVLQILRSNQALVIIRLPALQVVVSALAIVTKELIDCERAYQALKVKFLECHVMVSRMTTLCIAGRQSPNCLEIVKRAMMGSSGCSWTSARPSG